MHSILISTECVADIPEELIQKYDIDIIYYDVATEEGIFKDTAEIDAENLMEYIREGRKKAHSVIPSASDYKNFFNRGLEKYEEIIHISISDGISNAHENALLAKSKMGIDGRKVKILNSKHLSSGQGILTIEAAKYRDAGFSSSEIVERLTKIIPDIQTSFISYNADYLYYNGKVGKRVKDLCNLLKLHPVLWLNEEGKLVVKRVYIGNYEKASFKYIKKTLKNKKTVDSKVGFVTYAGCSHEKLNWVQEQVKKYVTFENFFEVTASATVSCNCGPGTFGIIFKRNGEEK